MESTPLLTIIDKYKDRKGGLIAILDAIQFRAGYLPEDQLNKVAEHSSFNLVDIYGVATFYRAFSLKPRGEHLVAVCRGTACHVRGAPTVCEAVEAHLGIQAGGTTEDKVFSLETVACLGACALGPIVVVDGEYFSNVRPTDVAEILENVRSGAGKQHEIGERDFPIEVSCPVCNHTLMDPEYLIDGHPSVRMVVSYARKHGSLRLSSVYGSYEIAVDHEIPKDTVVNMFCPHCHSELRRVAECSTCFAPMIPMLVHGGGTVQICTRRGCPGHRLDIDGENL